MQFLDIFSGALLILLMRMCDVSIATMRTILVVQGRKYIAASAGFFEVLIWIFAITYVMQHLDNVVNLFAYAAGFSLGTIIGITIEQKIGLGFVQLTIISKHYTDQIVNKLRKSKYGVTILPAEGGTGGVSIILLVTPRKNQRNVISLIESIDKDSFITVQHSVPYRGFFQASRK